MTPSVLLFDFGGTLDADGVPWKDRFHRLFSEEGAVGAAERFDRAFYDADDALVGHLPVSLDLTGTVRRLSADVAAALGLADTAAAGRVADRFLQGARAALRTAEALLSRLASRYRLGIVSNFYGNLDAVCREAGLTPHLGVAVDSAVVGASKPDPRIFEAALTALGARPHQALFVGDSQPRDMAGARALGMPHVWLRGERRDGASACCPDDRVIGRLSDLEEVLP